MQETFPVIFTPSYEKEEEVMNENLILEGNTIYEIDPDCMRMKMQPQQRQAAGGGVTGTGAEGDRRAEYEEFGYGSSSSRSRSSCALLGALILAGCQAKRRGRNNFCGR